MHPHAPNGLQERSARHAVVCPPINTTEVRPDLVPFGAPPPVIVPFVLVRQPTLASVSDSREVGTTMPATYADPQRKTIGSAKATVMTTSVAKATAAPTRRSPDHALAALPPPGA